MRLLITGGFGYVGGRVAQYLAVRKGYDIFLGSRRPVTTPSWLPQAKGIHLAWDSITALEDVCSDMDAVLHLAGMNAQECAANFTAAFEVNAVSTSRLLQASIRKGVKRFIYFSTAHVYGCPLVGTIDEETCPVSIHPYAASHRAGEDIVRAAHQRKEIEGIVIRLSNAFGVPAHKDVDCWILLVNDLCRQAVSQKELRLHSSGMQIRNFITLSDVTRAVQHLLEYPSQGLGDGLYNLGGDITLRVFDMARHIADRCESLMGFKPAILCPKPEQNSVSVPLDYRFDKFCKLGFQLKGEMDEEIDDTLMFCATRFE